MKGILVDLGVMRIHLKEYAKPIKQHPYRLNPRYKEKVNKEFDKILVILTSSSLKEVTMLKDKI